MNLFVFILACGKTVSVHGFNMIDACYRLDERVELKEISSYKEGDSEIVHFSK